MERSKKIENVNTQSQLGEIGALINDARAETAKQGTKRKAPARIKRNVGIDERNARDLELVKKRKQEKRTNVLDKVSLYNQLSTKRDVEGVDQGSYLVDFTSKATSEDYSDQDIYLALQEFYNRHNATHLTHKDYIDLVEVVKGRGLSYLNEKLMEKYGDAVRITTKRSAEPQLDTDIHTIQVEIVPSSKRLRRELIQKKLDEKREQIQNLIT